MSDPFTMLSGFAALGKAAIELAGAADAAKRNALLIEFQQALIQTQGTTAAEQAKNATLAARNQELESECARLRDWSAEKAQYKATEVSEGIFVYVHQDNAQPLKRAEKLCAHCFGLLRRSLLQYQTVEVGRRRSLICGDCKAALVFNSYIDERASA